MSLLHNRLCLSTAPGHFAVDVFAGMALVVGLAVALLALFLPSTRSEAEGLPA